MNPTLKSCPNCNQPYPSYEGFTDWCQACNWNVKEHRQTVYNESTYATFVNKLGNRFSKQLYEQVKTIQDVKPKPSWLTFFTLAVASGVFLSWVMFIVLDVWLLTKLPNMFAILGCIICSLIVVTFRPRFNLPPDTFITQAEAPILFGIIEDLRLKLGASKIDYLVIDQKFNASMGYTGFQRKRVLTLGYPLLFVLDAQETVELISHELAHDVNRDPSRGYMQWYAFESLWRWYKVTHPVEIITTDAGLYGVLLSIPFNLAMWCISQVFLGCAYLLSWLLWRDSQRAEYYADYLAVTMSGTKSSESSFMKVSYHNFLELAVQKSVVHRKENDVFDLFRESIASIPPREIERIQRVNLLYNSKVDSSHPPTAYRIGFVQSRGILEPGYVLDEERHTLLLTELKKFESEISRKLVDEYKDWIYNA